MMENSGKLLEKQGQQSQEEKHTRHFFEGVSFGQGQKNIQQDGSSTSRHGEKHHLDGISGHEGGGSELPKGESEYNEVRAKEKMAEGLSPERKVQLESYIGYL
jgi:hypothetical protein